MSNLKEFENEQEVNSFLDEIKKNILTAISENRKVEYGHFSSVQDDQLSVNTYQINTWDKVTFYVNELATED